MTKSQKIIWMTLPNGWSADGKHLQLSLYVSPRLEIDNRADSAKSANNKKISTLATDFNDFVDWPKTLNRFLPSLKVQLGNNQLVPQILSAPADASLWKLIFPQNTFVRPYQFDAHDDKYFFSYSNRHLMDFIQKSYSVAVIKNLHEFPKVDEIISPRGLLAALPAINGSSLLQQEAPIKLNALANQRPRAIPRKSDSNPANDFLEFHQFHQRKQLPKEKFELPALPEPEFDFHQIVSAMGQYPALMRNLGLVVDLQIPVDMDWLNKSEHTVRLTHPDFVKAGERVSLAPWSNCYLNKNIFTAKAEANSPLLDKGMLRLDKDNFDTHQIDVDGASIKLMDLAGNLRHANSDTSIDGQPLKTIDTAKNAALPSLRSAGLSICLDGRANVLDDRLTRAKELNNQAFNSNGEPNEKLTLSAEILNRGYRVDVYDVGLDRWYSLCQRKGLYQISDPVSPHSLRRELKIDDEGQVNFSASTDGSETTGLEKTNNLYVLESIFRWDGWSLVAPRPGRSVTQPYKKIQKDGAGNEKEIVVAESHGYQENLTTTPFKLKTEFKPKPGSLPRLRFGNSYRFRMRTVDIAGNSLSLDIASKFNPFSYATDKQYYARFEPVSNPLPVALKAYTEPNLYPEFKSDKDLTFSPGESMETLVIRSSYDGDLVAKANQRHIAPPRVAQQLAEAHGMFDGINSLNKQAYDMIIKFEENEDVDVSSDLKKYRKDKNGFFAGSQLPMSYLPDPIATAVAFQGLPGVEKGKVFVVGFYDRDSKGRPTGGHAKDRKLWPHALPFRLSVESDAKSENKPPKWHDGTLTIYLPPAAKLTVKYSSQIPEEVINMMGIARWAKQKSTPREFKDFMETVIRGNHWALTPWREMQLIHAVPRPKDLPELAFSLNPIVDLNFPAGPDMNALWDHVSQYENPLSQSELLEEGKKFFLEPFKMARSLGETHTRLWGFFALDGDSTGMLQLNAQWQDPVDDPSDDLGPQHQRYANRSPLTVNAPVLQCPVVLNGKNVKAAAGLIRYVETVKKQTGLQLGTYKQYSEPAKQGEFRPFISVPPIQEFGDTKARKVTYQAVISTRFREMFEPQRDVITKKLKADPALQSKADKIEASFTKTGEKISVIIPSSARPAAPSVRYIIPTFGWNRKTENGKHHASRLGGGLRIYLERPWYSSGDGEMLGVVLYLPPAEINNLAMRGSNKIPQEVAPYVTQWGQDPIWETAKPKTTPLEKIFKNVEFPGFNLSLDELAGDSNKPNPSLNVAVAGYHVHYDHERQLWYSDIIVDSGFSYSPFIRLALVRYQPFSIVDAHLSRVTKTDFVPLTADRHASVSVKSKSNTSLALNVAITANTYYTNSAVRRGGSVMEASIEVKNPNIEDADLSWQPMFDSTVLLKNEIKDERNRFFQDSSWSPPKTHWWHNIVTITNFDSAKEYRLVVKEYESFEESNEESLKAPANPLEKLIEPTTRRLVYADTLEIKNIL